MELVHRAHHPLAAPAVAQLGDATRRKNVRRLLSAEVALALAPRPDIREQHAQDASIEPRRWKHDALLEELGRERGLASRLHPPDVSVMGTADREPDVRRRHHRDVRQMRPASVRVVQHEDLARLRVVLHDGLNRLRHGSQVDRNVLGLGDHPAACVEQRGRAVALAP